MTTNPTPPTYQPGGPVAAGPVRLEPGEELIAALDLGMKLTLEEGRQVAAHVHTAEAERDRLTAIVAAVREIHRPIRIYGECGHTHDDPDVDGVLYVDDVGLTCEAGYLYTICAECCTDGGEPTEECTDYHPHEGPAACWPCPTLAALDTQETP